MHTEVCTRAWDDERQTFTQSYGAHALDASLLHIPLVGFLPPDDARVGGTVQAIERELCDDGLVRRYRTDEADDGLPGGEGTFLACTFWLADVYAARGDIGPRARSSSGCSGCATTSGCSASSTTRWPAVSSATCPRHTATSVWYGPRSHCRPEAPRPSHGRTDSGV